MAESEFPHLPTCVEGVDRIMSDIINDSFVMDGGHGLIDVVRLEDVFEALCKEFDVAPEETNYRQYSK